MILPDIFSDPDFGKTPDQINAEKFYHNVVYQFNRLANSFFQLKRKLTKNKKKL